MRKSSVLCVILAAYAVLQISLAVAQECGSEAGGAACASSTDCCSQYGYCNTGDAYCGTGCQSGPCYSYTPSTPSSGSGLSKVLSRQMFDTFFPNKIPFYTYDSFTAAAAAFGSFATSGSSDDQKREVAAFCAHVQQESGGLQFIDEIDKSGNYCQDSAQYPCAAGQEYFGRGPLQISYNYNYGAAVSSVGYDILNNPGQIDNDATLAFKTALWFWTTASSPKPSCHDVMVGNWTPSSSDSAAGRLVGFGVTTDIINGGVECLGGNNPQANTARVSNYQNFCSLLGVDPGQNLSCANMQPF